MADISDLAPIQQMTLLEQCPKEERRALHGLLLMRSSASYSAAPPSVEEMERAGEAKEVEETEEEKTARKAYIKRCMTASYGLALLEKSTCYSDVSPVDTSLPDSPAGC